MTYAVAVDMPKTRWATTVDGACIAYQDFGEGPVTLVVIHGWVSHLEIYWEQPRFARFMRRLAKNMRVLQFDKRGVGMSDRLTGPPGLDVQMDDVRAVMDAAAVERAALFGWGNGGPALACMFAATSPERVLALCIDAEICHAEDVPIGVTQGEQDELLARMLAVWGDDAQADEFVRQGFGDSPAARALARDPAFLRWSGRFMRCAATPASYKAFDQMWYETDVRDVLASVHVPTLVLGKADAKDADWDAMNDYCVARIPGARQALVPGREGVVWVEEPEPLVRAIEAFIDSVRHEEAVLDRALATVLFTDIVGSTDKACEVGDARWKELLAKHDAHGARLARALSRQRGEDHRRRLPRDLRRSGARREVRPGHLRGGEAAGTRGARRLPHRRDRAAGRRCGRHRRPHRRPGRRSRRALRGPRQLDRQGPRRRLGPHLRGPRRAPAEGHR